MAKQKKMKIKTSRKKTGKNTGKKTPSKLSKLKEVSFPIVGIGASAGGLESFQQFFSSLSVNCGIAFVIVTHLDKAHESTLPEIVEKYTDLQVMLIEEGMKVKPNVIYFIPPNRNLTINKGVLHLEAQDDSQTVNLPINYFLESLAQDKKEESIAIILSGAGTDGTLGIKAIKSEGGFVIVQDPASAAFNGMPMSAAKTGLADLVLPLEKIPGALFKYVNYGEFKTSGVSREIQEIFQLLHTQTGHDFSSYKLNTIYRRIERQMQAQHIRALPDYMKLLRGNPQEVITLFKDLLIGVTRFFRDPEAFEVLKNNVLPMLLKNKPADYSIRVWIPGCSTGEEVYSLAIILRECLDKMNKRNPVQIFGTDIDESALEYARSGIYSENVVNEVSPERLKRFFTKEKNLYRIKKEIREMVVFGVQNIIKDPPFTKLDLICCRNLLIYFNTPLQKKLLPVFHFSLKSKGILFLGTSEAISGHDDLFHLLVKKWKIFERNDVESYPYPGFDFSNIITAKSINIITHKDTTMKKLDLLESIDQYLIQNYVPSCLIINKEGDIIYSHGKIDRYIELHDKKNQQIQNIYEIVSSKIKNKFKTALRTAYVKKKNVDYKQLSIEKPRGKQAILNLKIIPILDPNITDDLFFLVFNEKITAKDIAQIKNKYGSLAKMSKKIIELEEELQYSKENLQTTIEELQSSNEELQSTNEEMQSTNEEIETSKEELQSLNEELITVNSELQNKIHQLASINDDMNNLFNSTEIAAIFLDNDLRIKRFTPKVQDLIPLIQTDIGRPIKHFSMSIKYERLVQDVEEVLKTLKAKTVETRDKDDNFFLVRLLPYRTLSNIVDGVIVLFNDISSHKEAENKLVALNTALNDSVAFAKSILHNLNAPMLVLSEELRVISANNSFYKCFKIQEKNIENKDLRLIIDNKLLFEKLENMIKKNIHFKEFEIDFKEGENKYFIVRIYKIMREAEEKNIIVLMLEEKK